MIAAITGALSDVLSWVGDVVEALIDTDGALNGLLIPFAITVGISLIFLGIKAIRSLTFGA